MAILRSCCWWNNVAYGSYGSAVYSFLIGGIFTIFVVFDIQPFHFFGTSFHGHVISLGSYMEVMGGVALCLSACVLVAGIYRSIKQLLLPWIVCMVLFTLVLVTGNIHLLIRKREKDNPRGSADVLIVVMSIIFCLLNIYGELCVISHYQNLCGGVDTNKEFMLREKKSVNFFKKKNFNNSRTWSNSFGHNLPALTRLPIRISVPTHAFISKTTTHTIMDKSDSETDLSRMGRFRMCSSSSGSEGLTEVERDMTTPGPEHQPTPLYAGLENYNRKENNYSRLSDSLALLRSQLEALRLSATAGKANVVIPV